MRSAPNNNETLIKIQNEIHEVARRETELRQTQQTAGFRQNSLNEESISKTNGEVPKILQRAVSTSSIYSQTSTNGTNGNNGTQRRFIPNSKGVMQKFFKLRGKVTAVNAISNPIQAPPKQAWASTETSAPPVKALIPSDKPLRKGYVPVEKRILSELREMENREQELKVERRKSQPDLMASLEAEEEIEVSRSPSPVTIGKLKSARSLSHLLDEEYQIETNSAPASLKPARSLAQLCDVSDDEVNTPRSLIKQWETRIKQSQREGQL